MLTQVQIAAKRTERNMNSRAKARGRATAHGLKAELTARNREKTSAWLADMGMAQEKAQQDLDARVKQARESSRTKAAMSRVPPKGFIGRVKAFFRRTP